MFKRSSDKNIKKHIIFVDYQYTVANCYVMTLINRYIALLTIEERTQLYEIF